MEWIKCSERLPVQLPENWPTMDWVLVTTKESPFPINIARYDGDKWEFLDTNDSWTYGAMLGDCTSPMDIKDIYFWMPLPLPPKE